MNLLIVDDDSTNRKLLRAQLEGEGHSVLDATNGVEALQVLDREKSVDGIVSDILMPDMDGFQLCLEVRRNKKVATLPFIFYTSTYSSPQDQQLAKTVGADNYLSKPSPTPVLLAALNEAAQRTRPRIAAAAAQQDETYVLRQYNSALVRKLEQRNIELEEALKNLNVAHRDTRESEERLVAMVKTAVEGIITIDDRGLVESMNPAAEKIFGYTLDELHGQNVARLMPAPHANQHDGYIEHFVRTGNKKIIGIGREVSGLRKDGTVFPMDLAVTEFRADGKRKYSGFIRDITERKQAEAARHALEARFRALIENGFDAISMLTADGKVIYRSPAATRVLGYSMNELLRQKAFDLVHPDDLQLAQGMFESLLAKPHEIVHGVMRFRHKNGNWLWLEGAGANLLSQPEVGAIVMNYRDVTDRVLQEQKIEKLSRIRAVSSEINAAIVRIHDREALLKETCRIAAEHGKFDLAWIGTIDVGKEQVQPVVWTGFSTEAAHRVNWKSISAAQGTLGEAIRTRKISFRNDIETQLPVGGMRGEAVARGHRSTVCLPLLVDDSVVALIALFAPGAGFFDKDELALLEEAAADVSFALQSIARQEKVQYLSYYDPLTALPNRSLFIDRLSQQLHGRGEERPMVAVVLLNLERFRNINETLGRHGGDELLKLVALRLENAFHGKDYLARIGADGFGVVIRGIRDTGAAAHTVQDQVLGCFHEPFRLNGSELRVAAKAGVAVFPADGNDADTLFRNAEAALKKARDNGEHLLFYAAEMNARAAQVLSLETRLRKAVEAQEFVLHYQPKYTLTDGKICAMEALIRWQDPASGLVAPGVFIPLLEETGLILEVGKWALGQALAQHREWTARGCTPPRIAVNVSAIQLQQKDFADIVIDVLQSQGDNPDALELEVTESLLMKDVQASIRKLTILRGLGITIAMDDFGTGYSSLAYIARLPITSIKIDRSFITGMTSSPQDMGIVTTIIGLAHSMNLKVVAEGVETEEQSQLLKLLKCDEAQGYLFSKPLPPAEIEALLRARAK